MPLPILPLIAWPVGLLLAAGTFGAVGRHDEHEDPVSRGSRKKPRCLPKMGSVVFRIMPLLFVEHSGVYVGEGKFVSKDKNGKVVVETLDEFLESSDNTLYVSARSDLTQYGRRRVARRAKEEIGKRRAHGCFGNDNDPDYFFLTNNCHIFTSYCLTGERNTDTSLTELKAKAGRHAGMTKWLAWEFED